MRLRPGYDPVSLEGVPARRMPGVRIGRALALAVLLGATSAPPTASACSVCRCGDPTFNALGKEGFSARGFRAALDWERFEKEEGDPSVQSEVQVENRFTALASYGFGDRVMLFARAPYSVRNLTTTIPGDEPEVVHTHGLSDPEFYGQLRLWASHFNPKVGRRTSLSLVAGVKTPWGDNDVRQEGVRVDEHAQPGTGAMDALGSLALLYLIDRQSALFVSSAYRHTGTNAFGYRYGSSFMGNVAYEHKVGRLLDGVVELNFRHAAKDQVDAGGALDDDTGGSLLYLTPRLLVNLGSGLVLRAGAQIPIVRDLNGYQKEKAVVNIGVTYLFSH
jgi:hypothetical protein